MSTKGIPGPIIARRAHSAVKAQHIVRVTQNDGGVELSTNAAADAHIGVADRPAAAGATVDVQVYGVASVVFGAAVPEGSRLKSDNDGKAIAAGANDRTIGMSLRNVAAEDDISEILICPGTV